MWYKYAFSIISNIQDENQRIYVEILLLNGLALVEYHCGNNDKSLSLEFDALNLANKNHKNKEWAVQLCNSNISKLMRKRFNNEEMTISYLKKNLEINLSYVQEYARMELAKLYFQNKNYYETVNVLETLFEDCDGKFDIKNKEQEMISRLIFVTSLLAIDERNRVKDQIPYLQYLCNIFNAPIENGMLEKIQTCL